MGQHQGMVIARAHLTERRLYLCTSDRPDLEKFIASCIRGGVDIVQLRDKELDARPLLERARLALRVCRGLGVPFILNDRPDLALEVGADGVHVGQDDVAPAEARRLAGAGRFVGLSTHSPAQIAAAHAAGVDYIGVGPVWETATKPGRPAVGLELVAEAARSARLPWFAIGGIDLANLAQVREAGATRLAVVRAIRDAADPEAAARAFRSALPA